MMAGIRKPGRLAFSPTRREVSTRNIEYEDEQRQESFGRRGSTVTAASATGMFTGDDSGPRQYYYQWINVQFRIRTVTLLRWRSLAENLGLKGDDQVASYLLNMYYERCIDSTSSQQQMRETPQGSGKAKGTVETSSRQDNLHVDRTDGIESETLPIQGQQEERIHIECRDSMQEEGPGDVWMADGGATNDDGVGSNEMEVRPSKEGELTCIIKQEPVDTCGDDDIANQDDTIDNNPLHSNQMEVRLSEEGALNGDDDITNKDDTSDNNGLHSNEMEVRPSEERALNGDDDITNKDDTSDNNGLHSNEMEVRPSEEGVLRCVIKEEPVDIGEEEPVDFIKKEPVDIDEETNLHEAPSCSTQDKNSSTSRLNFYQTSENIQETSGDTSHDRSHDEEHLSEDLSLETLPGSQSSSSAQDGHASNLASGILSNQVDYSQGPSSDNIVPKANVFLCSVCKKAFINRHELCKHLKLTHGVEKPYACTLCTRNFKFRCELKRHLKNHTGEKHTTGSSSSDIIVPEANGFLCSVCKKVFNGKDELCKHLKFIRGVEKPYDCTICARNFKFRCELTRHLKDHRREDPYPFLSGNKRFRDAHVYNNLNNHTSDCTGGKKRKSGEKRFPCSFCSKTFTGSSSLNRHVKTHTEGKAFKCMDCNMRFDDSDALTKHATMHMDEKPFECSICGKRYSNKYHFSDHVKLHTGERPHACPMCERRFIRKADMKRHVTIHTGERPYACSACPKRFRNRNTFVLHMKIHTNTH